MQKNIGIYDLLIIKVFHLSNKNKNGSFHINKSTNLEEFNLGIVNNLNNKHQAFRRKSFLQEQFNT